jgi:hypothetical protein
MFEEAGKQKRSGQARVRRFFERTEFTLARKKEEIEVEIVEAKRKIQKYNYPSTFSLWTDKTRHSFNLTSYFICRLRLNILSICDSIHNFLGLLSPLLPDQEV